MNERIEFTTYSGSIYTIDKETMMWYRRSDHEIRGWAADSGPMAFWPHVELDQSVYIPDGRAGGIWTSYVLSIKRTGVEIPHG